MVFKSLLFCFIAQPERSETTTRICHMCVQYFEEVAWLITVPKFCQMCGRKTYIDAKSLGDKHSLYSIKILAYSIELSLPSCRRTPYEFARILSQSCTSMNILPLMVYCPYIVYCFLIYCFRYYNLIILL